MKNIQTGVRDLATIERNGHEQLAAAVSRVSEEISSLNDTIQEELSNLASVLEWGFEEIRWELQQQTHILKSIDRTLRNPTQTQAHEWRRMAEQLRERGCLNEAAEWFQKALKANPLDYRTYVGLAMTCLWGKNFGKAKELLEKSLPHAPKCKRLIVEPTSTVGQILCSSGRGTEFTIPSRGFGDDRHDLTEALGLNRKRRRKKIEEMTDDEAIDEAFGFGDESDDLKSQIARLDARYIRTFQFDYQSNSYRLIGRIHACRDDWANATSALRSAIQLSPEYEEGNYEYAQYCVQSGDRQEWIGPLLRATTAKPAYQYMALAERNFAPVRSELARLLTAIKEANRNIREAEKSQHQSESFLHSFLRSRDFPELFRLYDRAVRKLAEAKEDAASGDYRKVLEAPIKASQARELADSATKQAVLRMGPPPDDVNVSPQKAQGLPASPSGIIAAIGRAIGLWKR
jgi:tetratricopeptide (TPR) repeat protein